MKVLGNTVEKWCVTLRMCEGRDRGRGCFHQRFGICFNFALLEQSGVQ